MKAKFIVLSLIISSFCCFGRSISTDDERFNINGLITIHYEESDSLTYLKEASVQCQKQEMITRIDNILLMILFLAAVVSCGATRDFHHNERTVPVEIMEWSSSDSIRSNVNINVSYKYGADSLQHYLQKQYVNRFYRKTEIEYGIRRIYILIRFSGNDPEKVFLLLPPQSSKIDTRIGEIIGSSIDSLKNEWIFPEHSDNTKANAALSLINVP